MITLLQESSNINEQQIMSYSVKLFDELSKEVTSKLDTLLQKYPNRYMSIVLPCFAKVMNTLDKNIYEKKSGILNVTYYAEPDISKDGGPCWFFLDASSYVDVEEFYNYLWDKYDRNNSMGNLCLEENGAWFGAPDGEDVAEYVITILKTGKFDNPMSIGKQLISDFVQFIENYCNEVFSRVDESLTKSSITHRKIIVYDDSHLEEVATDILKVLKRIPANEVSEYDWGMYRVQRDKVISYIFDHIKVPCKLGKSTNTTRIGNNWKKELIYTGNPEEEQICGDLCLIDNMYGSIIAYIVDIDGNRVGNSIEIHSTRR